MWSYRVALEDPGDIGGYSVHALDGHIGRVDKHSIEEDRSSVLVDTAPWILGKKVLLPAGVIERIDNEHREVFVDLTKDQIKNAPEYSEEIHESPDYRNTLAGYYGALD
jgi:hypothetical protein